MKKKKKSALPGKERIVLDLHPGPLKTRLPISIYGDFQRLFDYMVIGSPEAESFRSAAKIFNDTIQNTKEVDNDEILKEFEILSCHIYLKVLRLQRWFKTSSLLPLVTIDTEKLEETA